MPYYPTLAEDVARAKEILAEGVKKPGGHGAIIHAKDIFTAYVLLESFVEVIEVVDPKVCELALRHQHRLREVRAAVRRELDEEPPAE